MTPGQGNAFAHIGLGRHGTKDARGLGSSQLVRRPAQAIVRKIGRLAAGAHHHRHIRGRSGARRPERAGTCR